MGDVLRASRAVPRGAWDDCRSGRRQGNESSTKKRRERRWPLSKPLYEIIERPLITEKSVRLSQQGRFRSLQNQREQIEIRRRRRAGYGVKVVGVNTLTVKGKVKQAGRERRGKVADWKKRL